MNILRLPLNPVKDFSFLVGVSFLIALLGQISIPLPFTPIPIVTQLQAIFLLPFLLGGNRALFVVALFLLEGAIGFPVFANGGAGLPILLGPRGGYLLGYLVSTSFLTYFAKNSHSSLQKLLLLCGANGLVYLLGWAHLSSFLGMQSALLLGVAPFILGDFFKNLLCVKIVEKYSRSTNSDSFDAFK